MIYVVIVIAHNKIQPYYDSTKNNKIQSWLNVKYVLISSEPNTRLQKPELDKSKVTAFLIPNFCVYPELVSF